MARLEQKPFAAFDIDGTIFRWQLYHELFDVFVEKQIITQANAAPVLSAREAWRKRTGEYHSYEEALVAATQAAVNGVDEEVFNAACDAILKGKGHRTYRYTLDLLQQLKQQGYVIIAISGSHQQLVQRFATIHSIDIAIGRDHTIVDGKLTEDATEVFGHKRQILQDTVRRHDLTWDGSYAVGDSGSDIGMLEQVENPVAFNPDEALKNEAIKSGWPIVVERKSIAYRLEKGPDGSYILA